MGESPRRTLEFPLSTLEFARTAGKAGRPEDQDVFVHDQVPGLAAAACLADVVKLENDGRGISLPPRSPASSATHRAAGIRPAAAPAARTAAGRSTSSPW